MYNYVTIAAAMRQCRKNKFVFWKPTAADENDEIAMISNKSSLIYSYQPTAIIFILYIVFIGFICQHIRGKEHISRSDLRGRRRLVRQRQKDEEDLN
jgi:hypothetical protein